MKYFISLLAAFLLAVPVANEWDQIKVLRESAEVLEKQTDRMREREREDRRDRQMNYPALYPSRCETILIDGKWVQVCR
jgi:hypothetical protein